MLLVGQTLKPGSLPNYGTGTNQEVTQDQFGAVAVSEFNARYYNLVAQGLVYGVQFASAATAAASATATGAFCLFNPASSGKNLVLLDMTMLLNAFTAATTGLVAGIQLVSNQTPSTITAGNTPSNLLAGSTNGAVAKPYTAGTLVGAPTGVARISGGWYFDLAASALQTSIKDQVDGAIVIAPGSMANIVSVANTPTIIAGLTWAEIPV